MGTKNKRLDLIFYILLSLLALVFIAPVLIVLANSFKGQFYITDSPFTLPDANTFVGLENYVSGLRKTGFFSAFLYSTFITVCSVIVIVFFTSMAAWYISRVRNIFTKALYYALVFSMIVPFQMVMFSMSKIANAMRLDNPIGIIFIYLGFGAGLSVFLFTGFVSGIPREVEEAAMIDGASPIRLYFSVVFPMMKPISITVAILNAMWIWNDYLLPYLVIGNKYKTIPIAVQYLQGGYGSRDMGALMAMLVLSLIPVVIFYLTCQKYIIKGVVAGAVKG